MDEKTVEQQAEIDRADEQARVATEPWVGETVERGPEDGLAVQPADTFRAATIDPYSGAPLSTDDVFAHPAATAHIYNYEFALDGIIEQARKLHESLMAHKLALHQSRARRIERGDTYDSARGHRSIADPALTR